MFCLPDGKRTGYRGESKPVSYFYTKYAGQAFINRLQPILRAHFPLTIDNIPLR